MFLSQPPGQRGGSSGKISWHMKHCFISQHQALFIKVPACKIFTYIDYSKRIQSFFLSLVCLRHLKSPPPVKLEERQRVSFIYLDSEGKAIYTRWTCWWRLNGYLCGCQPGYGDPEESGNDILRRTGGGKGGLIIGKIVPERRARDVVQPSFGEKCDGRRFPSVFSAYSHLTDRNVNSQIYLSREREREREREP